MATDYYSAKALCPFWHKAVVGQNKIICEGINDDTRLQVWFKGDKTKLRTYIAKYCCMHYAMCPVYKMVMEQYDKKTEEA